MSAVASNVGHRDPGAWLVAGPYETHAEALAVADVKREACERDRRGDLLAWGTMRMEAAEPSLLGVWRPEPEPRAETGQAAGPEASAAGPRKPARPRKARKGTAGPGGAQNASQGQPGAADEAIIDPDKQAAWDRGELTRAEAELRVPSKNDIIIGSCCEGPPVGSDG